MEQVCPKCRSKDISYSAELEENRGAGEGCFHMNRKPLSGKAFYSFVGEGFVVLVNFLYQN